MAVDWSKAGTRIRHTPRTAAMGGRNPDWDMRHDRWKDEADYAGEALTAAQVIALVECPRVDCVIKGIPCIDARGQDMEAPHAERIRAAGEQRIEDAQA